MRSARHVPTVALLLACALVAVVAAGRTGADFSSATVNPGNSFSAATSFGSTAAATGAVAKSTAGTTTYRSTVLADGPQGYWRLGEPGTTTTIADSSGNGHNGTYAAGMVRGEAGALYDGDTAVRWGTSADAGQIPYAPSLDLNGSFTLELWMKINGLQGVSQRRVVMRRNDAANPWRVEYAQNGVLELIRGAATAASGSVGAASGRFNHLVVTYDGSKARWYLDGTLASTTTVAFGTTTGTGALTLGPDVFFSESVTVDELALYGSALDAAKVKAHYDAGRMLAADPCTAYRLYTNITSGGTPVTGVTSVSADISALTAGQASVPMTAGSYTVGGTTYAFRSAAFRPSVGPGSYGYSITWSDAGGTRTQTGLAAAVETAAPVTPTWVTGFVSTALDVPNLYSAAVYDQSLYDGTVFRGASGSIKVTKDATAAEYVARTGFTATTSLAFAVRLASLPTADVTSLAYFNTSATPLYLGYQASSQKLTLRWGANAPAVALTTVAAATWYALDFKVDTSTNPNTAAWRIAGIDQPSVELAAATQTVTDFRLGSATSADRFTANYDDAVQTQSLTDYPLGPVSVIHRNPNGMGTHSNPTHFQQSDGTAVTADTYTRLTNTGGSNSGIRQVTASVPSYLEITMHDAQHVCVRGVGVVAGIYKGGSQSSHLRTVVVNGATEAVVHEGDATGNMTNSIRASLLRPVTSPWSASELNGLLVRVGHSNDISPLPYWNGVTLEYYTNS